MLVAKIYTVSMMSVKCIMSWTYNHGCLDMVLNVRVYANVCVNLAHLCFFVGTYGGMALKLDKDMEMVDEEESKTEIGSLEISGWLWSTVDQKANSWLKSQPCQNIHFLCNFVYELCK